VSARDELARHLHVERRPYDPARHRGLYTVEELLAPWSEDPARTLDDAITEHYLATGAYEPTVEESLARRLHDHAIDEALLSVIGRSGQERTDLVGIMGGHSVSRRDESYAVTARCAFDLRRRGYRVMTGGGPGMMEAANFGAYMADAGRDGDFGIALDMLRAGPELPESRNWQADPTLVQQYRDYLAYAQQVRQHFPRPTAARPGVNVAVPTWFYGWEPTNLFADRIAKYFSNSLREDGLLSLCVGGVIYTAGGMGTTQELFADAAQNRYETFGLTSPMVLLGRKRWAVDTSHFQLLAELSRGQSWAEYVTAVDAPADAVAFLQAHPPKKLSV
jgi:predicted Rossmann-fold nucleotide-binding protein